MQIVAIGGSPRKGNCEWMLNQLALHLVEKGAQVHVIWLRKTDVKHCTGCLKCEDRKGYCQIKDAMNEIYPALIRADAIIMASPVYFEMISGLLKNFIDRTCPVWTKIGGKPLVGLLVAEEGIGQAVSNLRRYAQVCGLRWLGAVTTLAKNPGDTATKAGLNTKLKRLAARLIDSQQAARDKNITRK
jgi:multimeric flavodoxin WrbA